jgi:hypothetical protein
MGIPLDMAGQLGDDRRALLVMDALRGRNYATAVFVIGVLDVAEEFVDFEDSFRQIDQVRAVIREFLAERGGGGQKAGVPAHHHGQIDTGQGGVVQVGAHEGLGDEARSRRVSRRVVVADQVVVDGLRDVDAAQGIVGAPGFLADDAHRVRRIVAADVEEVADAMGLEDLEYLLAVLEVGLVARRAQRRGWGGATISMLWLVSWVRSRNSSLRMPDTP